MRSEDRYWKMESVSLSGYCRNVPSQQFSALLRLLWEQHLVEQPRIETRREVTTVTSCNLDRRKFPALIPVNSPQLSRASLKRTKGSTVFWSCYQTKIQTMAILQLIKYRVT